MLSSSPIAVVPILPKLPLVSSTKSKSSIISPWLAPVLGTISTRVQGCLSGVLTWQAVIKGSNNWRLVVKVGVLQPIQRRLEKSGPSIARSGVSAKRSGGLGLRSMSIATSGLEPERWSCEGAISHGPLGRNPRPLLNACQNKGSQNLTVIGSGHW